MSIFKSTFKSSIQNQFRAREAVVSQAPKPANSASVEYRDYNFHSYMSKNSWVRMSSFVDVNTKIGAKTYSDDELAKKYILEGGTLYVSGSNQYLRRGIYKKQGIYGSDIDLGTGKENLRPLGFRPMPGISSVQVTNKSAYGSLREATVKFYCWDKHQLEELEVLYMRTGYSVLLEWGWSKYLDSTNLSKLTMKDFDQSDHIDIFYDKNKALKNNKDDDIYEAIDKQVNKSHGNYDAMLGYIKNFSWNLLPNGGFECTTVLISRGEILSALKINNNSIHIDFSSAPPTTAKAANLSQFEKIFLNYVGLINSLELRNEDTGSNIEEGEFGSPVSGDPTKPYGGTVTSQSIDLFKNGIIPLVQGSTAVVDYLPTDAGSNFVKKLISEWTNVDSGTTTNNYFGGTLAINPDDPVFDNYGYGFEYIRMDCFIAFLNIFFNVKDHRKNCVTPILIPDKNQFLHTTNTISIDPTVAIISNTNAPDVFNLDGVTTGFIPYVYFAKTLYYTPPDFYSPDRFKLGHHKGRIRNIYLNVFKLIEIYKSKSSNGTDVDLLEYVQDVLNHVTKALGGINNFQLHTTKSNAQIIDVRYLESGEKNNKFTLGVFGLNNICRDVKMTSRIFESQSTMIGIAAQNNNNVGDIYSETQISFNKGLKDRLLPSKTLGKTTASAADWKKELQNLSLYLRQVYSVSGVIQDINFTSEILERVYSTYRSYLFQLDNLGKKAIIPFELELTVDGIGGIIIGQIFRIDVSLLPDMYHNSDVGFIVTGLTHKLDKNDWTTTIKAQICLMD